MKVTTPARLIKLGRLPLLVLAMILLALAGWAQAEPEPAPTDLEKLRKEVEQLRNDYQLLKTEIELLKGSKPAADPPMHSSGRPLPAMPAVKKPVMFNTPEADQILSALQVFPANNPWNEDISQLPVLPNSKEIIASIGANKRIAYNLDMSFILVPPDQDKIPVQITLYPQESEKGPFPVPSNAPMEEWPINGLKLQDHQRAEEKGKDPHLLVVDPINRMLYEFWQARLMKGGWEASCAAVFNLKTNELRPDRWTSSDAAGLPIFPAVIRFDEVERGMVEHAMRFTVQKSRQAYVYPATHYASPHKDANLPRMGERFRLRADFDISGVSPHTQAILKGLKKYGMFMADNGGNWRISVAPDTRIKGLDELRRLKGSDFEVVQTTGPNEGPRAPAPGGAATEKPKEGTLKEVTLRGSYLCLHNQMQRSKAHIGAFYAFDGPEEVQAAVKEVVAGFLLPGLDVRSFATFQELIDRKLLYHIEPNDVEKKAHKECEWWNATVEITGTIATRDNQRWLTPTKIRPTKLTIPEKLCQPDKPLVMPKNEPIILKVNDKISIKCVPIPAGSFMGGSPFYQDPRCHDEFPHECVLTRDFYMAETMTTQEVYEAVLGKNPTPEARRGPQFPVEYPAFDDIDKFCQVLSTKNNCTVRLPTSAEWEYAARVGTSNPCYPAKYAKQYSNIGNKNDKAVAVKTKEPNAWGLYDMLTVNAWHTCKDWAHGHFGPEKLVDPQGPPESTYFKGCRQSLGGDQKGPHPPIHYWVGDNGSIKGSPDGHYVGVFRVVVEAKSK